MGFGGGGGDSEPLPEPESVEPVPLEEGTNKVEAQRRARIAARGREGWSTHNTSGQGTNTRSAPDNQGARGETIQGEYKPSSRNTTPSHNDRSIRKQARMIG